MSKPQALIVAQPEYESWEPLPEAAAAARALASALADHGVAVAATELVGGAEKQVAETRIGDWLTKAADDARLILFWTGHGHADGNGHFLVCPSSPRSGLQPFNAIESQAIGQVIAQSPAEKILVIIDACYSGQAAGDLAAAFSRVLASRVPKPGHERAIAVIASAHPLEKAPEAVFCKALRAVLVDANESRPWTDRDQFIHTEFLARAIAKATAGRGSTPQYKADGLGQDFVPNPRYQPRIAAQNVEEGRQQPSQSDSAPPSILAPFGIEVGGAWRRSDGATHFDLAARGIEVGETGWYFVGRRRLLGELVAWLRSDDTGLRILTGPPGAGKSAVMGRIATLSDPQFLSAARAAGAIDTDDPIPPEGIVDVAIHAKGKTRDNCARALAQGLGIELGRDAAVDVDALIDKVGSIDRRLTVLVDALDEAKGGTGEEIVRGLIRPLSQLPKVRVLVGTRRSLDGQVVPAGEDRHGRLRQAFGEAALIDDLEDEPTTQEDIAAYARARLKHHRQNESDAAIAAAATRVADKAEGVFLYARIVSRTLQEAVRLDGPLPATAIDAFVADLQARFGDDRQAVDDQLAALAWGEGSGLTRRVWPAMATALAGGERDYDDDDVAKVLARAGWHIVEAGEDGQTVYRLAHQAFADHYRGKLSTMEGNVRITRALTDGVSGGAWLDTDRYLWRHLADHAADAGTLGRLVRDAGYLSIAEPMRLVRALTSIDAFDTESGRYAAIYERVADRLIGLTPIERMPYIHLMARIEEPGLARELEPPLPTAWRCQWAQVPSSARHRVVARLWPAAIALGTVEGRPVVVSGGYDSAIRLWDARTGEPADLPLRGHTDAVTALAFGEVEGQTVIVSGSRDQSIRLWDARTGECVNGPLHGHTDEVTSVALGEVEGRRVIVSGSDDKTIRSWDAHTGEAVGRPLEGHTGGVNSVALGEVGGRPVIVSGSDDETVRLWDARTGEAVGRPLEGHTGGVDSVALGEVGGRPVIVSGSSDETVRLWDGCTGDAIGLPLRGHTSLVNSVALGDVGGQLVIVSGSSDSTIQLWDAHTAEALGRPLDGHSSEVVCVVFGKVEGRPVVVSGSVDHTIRVWDVRAGEAADRRFDGHTGVVSSVEIAEVKGRAVIVSGGSDKTIRLWDATTGEAIGRPSSGHTSGVTSVGFGTVDGRSVFVSGSYDKTIRLWDAHTGEAVGRPLEGHTGGVNSVALGQVGNRPVIVSIDDDTIRLWDAHTGETVGRELKGGSGFGQSVALGEVEGRPVIVSASSDNTVRIWDVGTGDAVGPPLEGHTSGVICVALGLIVDRPVIVSGSWDETVRLWDARTGEAIGHPLEGHLHWVDSVALGQVEGRPVIVSGSADGTVRLWDGQSLAPLVAIELGERVTSVAVHDEAGVVAATYRGLVMLKFGS